MCGIAGLGFPIPKAETLLAEIGTTMARALIRRGPDDGGVWADGAAGLALAHRRLAIVDLTPAGHQPMRSDSGRFIMVFNGEIYNHPDLRKELEAEGRAPRWRGHSDTETLLAMIDAWGTSHSISRCVGMFAVAVWDRADRRLCLARDRMGEKPLYYGWVGHAFVFASDLGAVRRVPGFCNEVDRDALALFMQFGYVPAPHTIHRDLFKLPPGTLLSVSSADIQARHIPGPNAYWSVTGAAQAGARRRITSDDEGIRAVEGAMREAVAGQMMADVPLGAFLSGGVDSSAIVAMMQEVSARPVETFTIGFDEAGLDEAPYAAAVAKHLGTSHHEMRVSGADALDVVPRLPQLYDEPFADHSQIPTFLVAQAARRHVTVALTGDGGDEVFGGYNRHRMAHAIWRRLRNVPRPLRRGMGKAMLAVPARQWDRLGFLVPGVNHFGDKARKVATGLTSANSLGSFYLGSLGIWAPGRPLLGARDGAAVMDEPEDVADVGEPQQQMMLWDMLTYLPDDILVKVDRAAMGTSLETRAPFLDHRLVELAWRLPLAMKIRDGQSKWALRQVLYSRVPANLIERPKAGFTPPVGAWLRGPLRDWAECLLDEARLRDEGFFDPAPIRRLWLQHKSGRHDWTPRLWTVLMFQAWLTHPASEDRVTA